MKIRRLELTGFGPFRDRQVIDFTRFDDDGLFLITGRTGAGKSSILDGVCFALYGSAPRYGTGERSLRSHHCAPGEPTEVVLEFALRGAAYRLTRSPDHDRIGRGGRLVAQHAEARLDQQVDGDWSALAVGQRNVGLAMAELLPIKQDQFLQVILLAQNRFQEFLAAKTDQRRDLLRTLFGTDRFERFEQALIERRKALDLAAERSRARIAGAATAVAAQTPAEGGIERLATDTPDSGWFAAAEADAGAAAAEAATAAAAAQLAHEVASQRRDAARVVVAEQHRRRSAEAALLALMDSAPEILVLRGRLLLAERAERVRPQIEADRRESQASRQAARQRHECDAAWIAAFPRSAEHGDPAEAEAALHALLGELRPTLAEEAALPARRAALESARSAALAVEHELGAVRADLARAPDRGAALDAEIEAAAAVAGSMAARQQIVDATRQVEVAARRAADIESTLGAARTHEVAVLGVLSDRTRAHADLIERRFANAAAELAGRLAPGEPCAVCGSREHPVPAQTSEQVTSAVIEAAKQAAAVAQQEVDRAAERIGAARLRRAEAREASGGLSSAAAEQARAAADAELAIARAAVAAQQAALRRREAQAAASAAAHERERQLAEQHASGAARLQDAALDLHRREREVQRAAGGSASVAARIAVLQRESGLVAAVRRARADAATRLTQAEAASAQLASGLLEQGFSDAGAAVAARLSESDRAAAGRTVRAHDDQVAAARATLAEPQLADLPLDLIDLRPLEAAAAALLIDRDTAVGERGARDRAHAEVQRIVAAVQPELDGAERLLAEYAEVRQLAEVVNGREPNTRRMRLETYVLTAQLEQIIAAANSRLDTMTAGRFALVLDDELQHRNTETGLGLRVQDAHTGRARQTASLSGGESFLASLALALGLAEIVSAQAGGIALDTLFVDEGFGSLDPETLDVAMTALDGLRTGGRTVGLISHVESMQDRITAKLEVRVRQSGDSEVVEEAFTAAH